MVVVPDPIAGSAGSRVRLIFGDNGNEWLLLLNHDNGDTKWQVKDWKCIPGAVAKQINNCTAKGRDVKEVDFGPDGAWFVNGKKPDGSMSHSWWGGTVATDDIKPHHKVSFGTSLTGGETSVLIDGRNGYTWKNVHNDLVERLKLIHGRNKEIHFVRLFHNDLYVISDEEGMEWRLNNTHCDTEIRKPGKIEEVAMAGDGSWVIIRENKFVSSMGVDRDLEQKLSKFFSDQHRWANARRQDIRNARERLAREQEEEERQRFAQEQAERAAEQMRVAAENEARAAAEAAERERSQLQAREADRAAQERIERDAATRISSLEAKLEKRFLDEAEDIKDMEVKLQRRKRALLDEMPPEIRSRSGLSDDDQTTNTTTTNNNTCVVCHDETAVMAIVPCGHICLCTACSETCINDSNPCPLCRGDIQSVLRVYSGR